MYIYICIPTLFSRNFSNRVVLRLKPMKSLYHVIIESYSFHMVTNCSRGAGDGAHGKYLSDGLCLLGHGLFEEPKNIETG